jgi:hypothetical protein
MMASVYTPPNSSVTEVTTPSVTPLLASPADICIIGVAGPSGASYAQLQTTDVILLTGEDPIVLPTLSAINNDATLVSPVISVVDVLNPSYGTPLGAGYIEGIDFTVSYGQGPPDGTDGTIQRNSSGSIPDGTLVAVTYSYFPSDYFNAIRLYDIGSVESRFGPSYASTINGQTGQIYYTGIGSELSFAARVALTNGASSVICQPLFARATPGDPTSTQVAPSNAAVADATTWSDTLYTLRPYVDLDIIVPIVGQDGDYVSNQAIVEIFGTVQSHQYYMNGQQQYIVGIFGEDGTASNSIYQSLLGSNSGSVRSHASQLQSNFGNALSSQAVLLNNTSFQITSPGGYNNVFNVGGQYAAAAVAGALGGRAVSSSLTHSTLSGFSGLSDFRVPSDKNDDAGAGLMVVESYQNTIRIRHAITLDIVDGVARSELSVVRAKFLMMESIQETLDSQIIGRIIADGNSPVVVASAISGVLTLLQQASSIVAYSQVIATITSTNPTTITATFSYRPSFAVNYVKVNFSLDLTSSLITSNVSDTTSGS